MSATLPRISPPKEFMDMVRVRHSVTTFVETGTYQGKTALWASKHFVHVITIENSQSLYDQVIAQFGNTTNIEFLLGDTRTKLKEIVPRLTSPAIFWLDAHWSGAETYGEHDECPLIDEISIIGASEQEHVIFVDDARLFLSPPPKPHNTQQWPDISAVLHALSHGPCKRHVVIYGDVIVAIPTSIQGEMTTYYQDQATREESLVVQRPHLLTRLRTHFMRFV